MWIFQGDPLSGAIFNVSQADAVHYTEERHPSTPIFSMHDGHFIFGTVQQVMDAYETIYGKLAEIGLKIPDGKSKIYGSKDLDLDACDRAKELKLQIIDKSEGIEVAGSPVGTKQYETEFCIQKAEKILSNLDNLAELISTPMAYTRAQIQSAFMLTRLCYPQQMNHILKSCPPSVTLEGARLLDQGIEKFIFKLTNSVEYLPALNSPAMMSVLSRLHLKISKGGCGITSNENVREGAYVG
jgi:hypothetical protein